MMLEDVFQGLNPEGFGLDARTYTRWEVDIRNWVKTLHQAAGGRSRASLEKGKGASNAALQQHPRTDKQQVAAVPVVATEASSQPNAAEVSGQAEQDGTKAANESSAAKAAVGNTVESTPDTALQSSLPAANDTNANDTPSLTDTATPSVGEDNDAAAATKTGDATASDDTQHEAKTDADTETANAATEFPEIEAERTNTDADADADANAERDELGVLPSELPSRSGRADSRGIGQLDAAKLALAHLPIGSSQPLAELEEADELPVSPSADPSSSRQSSAPDEELGMPVDRWWDDIESVDVSGLVRAKEKRYNGLMEAIPSSVLEYEMTVTCKSGDSWKCSHRYSAFSGLYEEILRTCGMHVALPAFPSKDGGLKSELSQKRLRAFSAIMNAVVKNRRTLEIAAVQRFLQPTDTSNDYGFTRLRCGGAMFWAFKLVRVPLPCGPPQLSFVSFTPALCVVGSCVQCGDGPSLK